MGLVHFLCVAMRLQAVGPGARNDDGQVTKLRSTSWLYGLPPCALCMRARLVRCGCFTGRNPPGLSPGVLSPFLSFPVHDLRGHLLMHRDLEPRL